MNDKEKIKLLRNAALTGLGIALTQDIEQDIPIPEIPLWVADEMEALMNEQKEALSEEANATEYLVDLLLEVGPNQDADKASIDTE